jgi:DNA-directed RNA polymerase specialized sigma24 family protein
MAEGSKTQSGSTTSPESAPDQAQSAQRTGDVLDMIASNLYGVASMLVGEGEESAQVVETAVATADLDCICSVEQARKNGYKALAQAAIEAIERRRPGSLAVPEGIKSDDVCIEEDDLESAGITGEELVRMMAGPERGRVRQWLEKLPVAQRTVFVLRGVAGMGSAETADLLKASGAPGASGWSPEAVREVFRLGLCSLASQLLQARGAN